MIALEVFGIEPRGERSRSDQVTKQYRQLPTLDRARVRVPSVPPRENPRAIWSRSRRKTCLEPGLPRRRLAPAGRTTAAPHCPQNFLPLRDFGCAIRAVRPDLNGYLLTPLHCTLRQNSEAFHVNLKVTSVSRFRDGSKLQSVAGRTARSAHKCSIVSRSLQAGSDQVGTHAPGERNCPGPEVMTSGRGSCCFRSLSTGHCRAQSLYSYRFS